MEEFEFLGALTDFIPQIPNAQTFLDQVDTLDLSILERVHVQDFVVSEEEGLPIIEFALAIEGQTRLNIPGISFITLYFGETLPGYTFLRSHLAIGANGRLRLYDFRLAVEIHQPHLQRYSLDTDTAIADGLRFEVDSAIS
ncbi:MAG: hypothetical protein OES09_15470, partial [Gammaproteobacteria bacterium]|nr:hypothetical protein [Gammaproteobacteria bacterium]